MGSGTTLYHVPACARAAALPFSRLRKASAPKLSSVLCLLGSVFGREGALEEKTHEPVAGLAGGHFSCAPPKDSSQSQRTCSAQGTDKEAEQQMAPLTVRGSLESSGPELKTGIMLRVRISGGRGCTWEE